MSSSPNIIFIEHLNKIIQSSHDAFIISDSEMKIIYSNQTAQNIFGYSEKEMIGMSLQMLMPPERRNNYLYDMKSALEGNIVSNINDKSDLLGQRNNGQVFPIELTYINYLHENTNFFVSQIRDITEKKDRENELNKLTTALRVMAEINRLAVDSNDETEYLTKICNAITEIGKFPRSGVSIIKDTLNRDKLICNLAFSGYSFLCPPKEILLSELNPESLISIAVKEKRTEVCNDIIGRNLWKYWVNDPSKIEFESTIAVPLMFSGRVEGILRVFSKEPFYFSEEKVQLLEDLAKDISRGITVLRERKKLEMTTIALNVITEANRLLIRSDNIDPYLKGICDIITNVGGFAKALILFAENFDDEEYLVPKAYSGYFDNTLVSQPVKLVLIKHSESPTVLALKGKKTDVCRNIKARGLWKYWHDDPSKMEFDSTISIPLFKSDFVFGILRVYSYDPFSFSEPEIELFEDLSRDISHGIEVLRNKEAHQKTLQELEESENKYRSLFNSSNDAVFIADYETGIIIDANEKAEQLLGTGLREIIGMKHLDLFPEGQSYHDKYLKIFKENIENNVTSSEQFYIRTKSKKAIPVVVSSNVCYLNGRKVLQGIFRDISKPKMEEDRIRTIQKMEALGTLSGGIAHDINNILFPIIGFTQLALLEKDDPVKLSEYLNEVLTASNRAKQLVSQILTFCRKSESDKEPHKIQNIVKEAAKLISISLPSNVELQTVIDDDCEAILCDPVQIYQVVINLCTNAYQAMKEKGGILKVCLVRKGSPEIKILVDEQLKFDRFVCLIVSDTGCGMNKGTLDRIFEPYYTTKPKGEGTGLGLSVVSGIVKDHNGDIYVRTYMGEGTYFRILLPITEMDQPVKHEPVLVKPVKTHLNILVVDDEHQITSMLSHMLSELGYDSETCNDPNTAYEIFRSDPSKFHLVITDQTMPGMFGTDLTKKILSIRPDIPVILNTGYSPIASKKEAIEMGVSEFMMKPIMISELSAAIDKAVKKC
ncbi:MAG TPA: PAS domain S-box protein [Clostridiales bacterium]|nr:PAS domain S-box protein [Clostridiales bacterium]HQP70539.1 PAS domain S-box protein [Clostridiales bacterium]